jgi:hypothetical protein
MGSEKVMASNPALGPLEMLSGKWDVEIGDDPREARRIDRGERDRF